MHSIVYTKLSFSLLSQCNLSSYDSSKMSSEVYHVHTPRISSNYSNTQPVFWKRNTVEPHLSEPLISSCSDYNLCTFCLTPMVHTEQSSHTRSFEGKSNYTKMPEFWPSEEAKIGWLFALAMDNMTEKETMVLIMIDYGLHLHDDSHIRLFHSSGHGLVLL